jgi:hypothetical protein
MAVPFPGRKLFDGMKVYVERDARRLAMRAIIVGWRRSDFGTGFATADAGATLAPPVNSLDTRAGMIYSENRYRLFGIMLRAGAVK